MTPPATPPVTPPGPGTPGNGSERVAAVVVLFGPDEEVPGNLARVADQVERTYVVDNTPLADRAGRVDLPGAAVALDPGGNVGLATAYNLAARRADADGFAWLLLLDQDTAVRPGLVEALVAATGGPHEHVAVAGAGFTNPAAPDRVVVGAAGDDAGDDAGGAVAVPAVVSSGSLVRLAAWRDVGGFRDDLFVDYVDIEFCLRVRSHGWRVVQTSRVLMDHRMGYTREGSALFGLWRRRSSHYPPTRHYYLARNVVLTLRAGAGTDAAWARQELFRRAKFTVLSLVFEPHRAALLAATVRGLVDGLRGRGGPLARGGQEPSTASRQAGAQAAKE